MYMYVRGFGRVSRVLLLASIGLTGCLKRRSSSSIRGFRLFIRAFRRQKVHRPRPTRLGTNPTAGRRFPNQE